MKKIKCEYCNKEITTNNYSKHIRSHLNGNYELVQKHKSNHISHDGLNCIYCNKEYKNKNSLAQHEIRCKLNPNKIDTSKSFNNGNRPAWNKGLTKETDDRIQKCSETYKINHKLGLHKDTSGINNSSSNPKVKEKISNTCLQKSKNGEWHVSLAKNMHYNYNGIDLHGKWEVYYAKYLDENNINWIRNKDRFEYKYQNKKHYYTPDFYLVDTDEYIEIKGYSYNSGRDYAKWKQFPKDKKLIVLKYNDLEKLNVFNYDISEYI